MRIALAGLGHESNHYAPPTPIEAFEVLAGDGLLEANRNVGTVVGGVIAEAEAHGVALLPVFHADARPSGIVEQAAYDDLAGRLVAALAATPSIDAVILDLHGAGTAAEIDDIEADTTSRVRAVVGPATPIAVVLDLHGHPTRELAAAADIILGYQDYPHVDMADRGREAVRLLLEMLAGRLHPVTWVEPLSMLITTNANTFDGPAAGLKAVALEQERRPGMIECNVFHGFPWSDSPRTGASVVATADGDLALARDAAQAVAARVWELRASFAARDPEAPAVVAEALRRYVDRPIVIGDFPDNPGGGAPGDATHLLRAMIEAGTDGLCLATMIDPVTAAQAQAAGEGATIEVSLGGRGSPFGGEPVIGTATVVRLSDGQVRLSGPFAHGALMDYGPAARLRIGVVDVVVASRHRQTFDPEILLLHGIDPAEYRVVGVKSANHFRGGFGPIAGAILTVGGPGLLSPDLRQFPAARRRGPRYPLDPDVRYPIAVDQAG